MQLSLLMSFAERHRRWLFLAVVLFLPLAAILFASPANAATGTGSLVGAFTDTLKSPEAFLGTVANDRCQYLAMCRWSTVLSTPSSASIISINPLIMMGSIASIIFTGIAFFAAIVLQFMLFLTNSSFLGSLSYFVDGVFAGFIDVISAGKPTGSVGSVFGNAPLLLVVAILLLAFFAFTYITTIVRGQPGFGKRIGVGLFSIAALMIVGYQAQGNHAEYISDNGISSSRVSAMGGMGTQYKDQADANRFDKDGKPLAATAIDPSKPSSWNIASPGWFLAWGGQASNLATQVVSNLMDTVKIGANAVNPDSGGATISQAGSIDQCSIYIDNMHTILETSSSKSSILGNANKIAISYDKLLTSFILTPYTIAKYGPPSQTMQNSWCRDMENRALASPGSQVAIMMQTNMYGVKDGFLTNKGSMADGTFNGANADDTSRGLVNSAGAWNDGEGNGYRTSKGDGGTVNPESDKGEGDGNGGMYWSDSAYVAARAFSPNLSDVAGGNGTRPYDTNGKKSPGADIKDMGSNSARENANKYWFAACIWDSTASSMKINPEWKGVLKAKYASKLTAKEGSDEERIIMNDKDAGCHSSGIIGDSQNGVFPAAAAGYLDDTFGFKESPDWLDGISKALFGRSSPSMAVGAFSSAAGGTGGPAAMFYLSTNGFDPSGSLPFVAIALMLTVASFKFVMPLFMGSFIAQAVAVLALCISPILILLSGFGFQFVRSIAKKAIGMVVTAFLTFAVLIGLMEMAAVLAEVFRKILYTSWHPVIMQVLEMGLAGILAMTAVKLFAANALNINTTNMKEAMSSSLGFATGSQKMSTMFKRGPSGSASSSALGKIRESAQSARSSLVGAGVGALQGRVFGRGEDGKPKNPFQKFTDKLGGNKPKPGETTADGKPIPPKPDRKPTAKTIVENQEILPVAGLVGAAGVLGGGKGAADIPPNEKVLKMDQESVTKMAQDKKIQGTAAQGIDGGAKNANDIRSQWARINEMAKESPSGFTPDVPLFDRHITMGAQGFGGNVIDPSKMTPEQRKALLSGDLDQALHGSKKDKVAFGLPEKTQDAMQYDPLTGRFVPQAMVTSGTPPVSGKTQDAITVMGAFKDEDGTWQSQKFADPTVPSLSALQGPSPEGFVNPQAWEDSGKLQQWMLKENINPANMDSSKWPEERKTQLDTFMENSGSIYTALGADLPQLNDADLQKNAQKALGFAAPTIPLAGMQELEALRSSNSAGTEDGTSIQAAFMNMNNQLKEIGTNHNANVAQLIKSKTTEIVQKRKTQFEAEAAKIEARFDQDLAAVPAGGESHLETMLGTLLKNSSDASPSSVASMKSYAELLGNEVKKETTGEGSHDTTIAALKSLGEAFSKTNMGDAESINRLVNNLTDRLNTVRENKIQDRNNSLTNLESRLKSDIESIQSRAAVEAERDTASLYEATVKAARDQAYSGREGTSTRKKAILDWFPSMFNHDKTDSFNN